MDDASKALKSWVTFGGCVTVVLVLYWAQTVLVPIALAVLVTFVLTPPVAWLQRWVGRVAAVLLMVTLVFSVFGLAGWGLVRQMDHLDRDLPRYRANLLAKIADVRRAGKDGSVEKLQETIEDIKTDLEKTQAPRGSASRPVVVRDCQYPSAALGAAGAGAGAALLGRLPRRPATQPGLQDPLSRQEASRRVA